MSDNALTRPAGDSPQQTAANGVPYLNLDEASSNVISNLRICLKGQTVDLPQEGLALGRRWHVRGCCLRARSGGHAGRVAG
jgi:hypothetical protein